jgi:predicted Zn-dependent protease
MSTKRLAFLEQTTAKGTTDPFAWYGLALEYRNLERYDDAFRTFEALRGTNPDYVAMYLMCGGMLEKMARRDDARAWYEAGIAAAKAKRDGHAQGELESALAAMGSKAE